MRQPAVFFGHGSPMNALGGPYADAWRDLGQSIGKPRGVLMVSAHWETQGVSVTGQGRPPTIHDFGNFPAALHAYNYPAPGSAELVDRVCGLLSPTSVHISDGWGLDHGTWSVLTHVWPDADVPVVQLSLDRTRDPRGHFELGRQLRSLRDDGFVVAGSGDFVHNLRTWRRDAGAEPYDWATRFNDAVKTALIQRDSEALIDWIGLAEAAEMSVPTDEHYLPILYVAASACEDEPVTFFNDVIDGGSIGMTGVRFG